MSNPNYVPPELVEKAREIDLPTYFEMFEPGQLKRLSSGVYCTNEHDSLKMSNGKWFWWSRGIGGKNAIPHEVQTIPLSGCGAAAHRRHGAAFSAIPHRAK